MSQVEKNEKIVSVSQYNKYLKVIKPSVWLVIAAILILIFAAIIWIFNGNILTTQTSKCVVAKDIAYAYVEVERAVDIEVGQNVNVMSGDSIIGGVVQSVSNIPMGLEEAAQEFGSEELAKSVLPENGGIQVIAQLSRSVKSEVYTISNMEIITQDVAPIQILLGK